MDLFILKYLMQWLSREEMDTANKVQILDEALSISHGANILGKSMNSTILSLTIGK